METLEQIKARAEAAVPGAQLSIVKNDSPSAQHSLLVDAAHFGWLVPFAVGGLSAFFAIYPALAVAAYLRSEYCLSQGLAYERAWH